MLNALQPANYQARAAFGTSEPRSMDRLKSRIAAELGRDVFEAWFRGLELAGVRDGVATFTVATKFLKSWITNRYADRLATLATAEIDDVASVEVAVRAPTVPLRAVAPTSAPSPVVDPANTRAGVPSAERRQPSNSDPMTGSPVDPRNDFASYVVGEPNAQAFRAANDFVESPSGTLFLHSSTGLGKTHLLHAVANAAAATGRPALYLTAEKFIYGLAARLAAAKPAEVRYALAGYGFVIVDDLQFLQGAVAVAEFQRMVRTLSEAGKGIVAAADREVGALAHLPKDVAAAFRSGAVAGLAPMGVDLRYLVLKGKIDAARDKFPDVVVPEEVCRFVAESVTTTTRDLEGAVNRLVAYACMHAETVLSVQAAGAAIADLVRHGETRKVRIEDIQNLVATHYSVTRADVMSSRRTADVVRPRQIAMYVSKVLTNKSLPEIGRRFGGRDHTTVLHAFRKIEGLVAVDKTLASEIALFVEMLTD